MRKTSSTGSWIHYTCGLLSTKCRVLSMAEMRFDLVEEGEGSRSEVKKTRSNKKSLENTHVYQVLRRQAEQVISGEKDPDDVDFTLLRFVSKPRTDWEGKLVESKEMAEIISNTLEFGSAQKTKKSSKKKRNVGTEAVNPSVFMGIESKENLVVALERYRESLPSTISEEIPEKFQLQMMQPGDPERTANYCNCFQAKENENFISCDECQVWYHCSCMGINLETRHESELFICRKCEKIKEVEGQETVSKEDIRFFLKERLTFDEMIMLGIFSERAMSKMTTLESINACDLSCFDMHHVISVRQSECLLGRFLVSRTLDLLTNQNLNKPYKDGSVDNEEFVRLKALVLGGKSVLHSITGLDILEEVQSFQEKLKQAETVLQMYEEMRPKYLRLPVLLKVSMQLESDPHLKTLPVQRNFIAALTVAKKNLNLILADFKQFSKDLDLKIKENDITGAHSCKIASSRISDYKKDLEEAPLAMRVVESLLSDFAVIEAEKHTEIPLRLDSFLVLLKREVKGLMKAGESDLAKVWQSKRHLFETSKFVVQKAQKLKTELPQWKEISELEDPEEVLPTRAEVDAILEESEDSVLVMNSHIVKKMSDLKTNSTKFEKRNSGDYWASWESSKRHVFNIMKSGVLFGGDVVKMIRELKIHGQIVKFCNHRAFFSIQEIEELLEQADRKFEKDYYDKAELMVQEIKVFIEKSGEIQGREDLWSDKVLNEVLHIHKKLGNFKIKIPEKLKEFDNTAKALSWLVEIAEQSDLVLDKAEALDHLKYSFSYLVEKLLKQEDLFENMNIRTLVRLERTYSPGVFPQHPDLFKLSCRSAKRIWQKDLEEIDIGLGSLHYDDLKHLVKKWSVLDPNLEDLPKEIEKIVEDFKGFKALCEDMVRQPENLLSFDGSQTQIKTLFSKIVEYSALTGIDGKFESAQRCATMLLSFGLKMQKVLVYLSNDQQMKSLLNSSEIPVLEELVSTVNQRVQLRDTVSICSSTWRKSFDGIAVNLKKKVKEGNELAHLVDGLNQRTQKVTQKIAEMRKEKTVSLQIILEEIKGKPTIEEAKEILKKYEEFSVAGEEKQKLLEKSLAESSNLLETLKRLITETVIPFEGSQSNKENFQVFEKEYLRLLKRAELHPLYDQELGTYFLAGNICYKVYKLYFEPASPKKWLKIQEAIEEIVKSDQRVEGIIGSMSFLREFREQQLIVERVSEKIVKEKLTIEELRELTETISVCRPQKIGEVDIVHLREECRKITASLEEVRHATPEKRVGFEEVETCKELIDSFELEIEEADTGFLYAQIELFNSLNRLLQTAVKEGVLSNGFLIDFVASKYSTCTISSKFIDDQLIARQSSHQMYEQTESTIRLLDEDSFNDCEVKIPRLKPAWEITNKKLFFMIWVRKVVGVYSGKFPLSLAAIECLHEAGLEYFEKSKKLIPRDQRVIACVIYPKMVFLEDLLSKADSFLGDLSMCKSGKELDSRQDKFREKDKMDLSSVIIDMRTQLTYGSNIEYSRKKRTNVAQAVKNVVNVALPGEYGWNVNEDFKKIKELFEKLSNQDREVLYGRFNEMLEGGNFYPQKETLNLSLEAPISREDALQKRKPVVKPVNPASSMNQIRRTTEIVSRVSDESQGNTGTVVNVHSLSNLTSFTVDQDAITQAVRDAASSHLLSILKENPYFGTDEIQLKNGAKNLEIHLFSNEHKSKTSYNRAFHFLRSLLNRVSGLENISKDILKNRFNYDHIFQFSDKPEQKLLAIEREMKQNTTSRYNPLGIEDPASRKDRESGKNRNIDGASDRNLLSEVLKLTEAGASSKNNKLSKILGGTPTPIQSKKTKSRSKSRKRSRSQSLDSEGNRRKHRKEKKKEKKDKKKKNLEKAKFSSESEEEEESQAGKGGFSEEEPVKVPPQKIEEPRISQENRKQASVSPRELKKDQKVPVPGSWLRINLSKSKFRLYVNELKKQQNEGYSVSVSLYTSEAKEIVEQFPDFTKVATFVFDKYHKEVIDLEFQYQRKLTQQTKIKSMPASNQILLAGWVKPDGEEKEKLKLGHLENFLSKKGTSIFYSPASGLSIYIVLARHLKNESLKAIGIKDLYDSGTPIDLDKQMVFFLKRNPEREEKDAARLKCEVVQYFDYNKEKSLKYLFGPRTEGEVLVHKKPERERIQHDEASRGARQAEAAPRDDSMEELLVIVRGMQPNEVKDLFAEVDDKEMKQRLIDIINQHLPHLKPLIQQAQEGAQGAPPHPSAPIPGVPGGFGLGGNHGLVGNPQMMHGPMGYYPIGMPPPPPPSGSGSMKPPGPGMPGFPPHSDMNRPPMMPHHMNPAMMYGRIPPPNQFIVRPPMMMGPRPPTGSGQAGQNPQYSMGGGAGNSGGVHGNNPQSHMHMMYPGGFPMMTPANMSSMYPHLYPGQMNRDQKLPLSPKGNPEMHSREHDSSKK